MRTGYVLAALLAAAVTLGGAAQQQDPAPTQAQQRPVFRGGTHFVRVDAYPLQNGRIVEGLQPGDFEVFEDGKRQTVESFDFVKFDTFTPEAERREPNTQREGYDKAADPRYRVFVVVVDTIYAGNTDVYWIQKPLVHFLDRILGSRDLYGFLTTRNSVKDLVLGQKAIAIQSQVEDLFRSMNIDIDEGATQIANCRNAFNQLEGLYNLDRTYTALEGIVQQLGSLRQERKNVVFVTNALPRPRPDARLQQAAGGNLPKIGITNGRLGEGDTNSPFVSNERYCASEYQRLAYMDFDVRYRQLLDESKRANVSFYTITPGGLRAPANVAEQRAVTQANDDLISLAHETDGIAIVNSNDLDGGMKRIADDLAAYYVLGYYTTNTRFDGGIRSIKVRLKSGGQIRARRQYRAPTRDEIAALSNAPASSGATVTVEGPPKAASAAAPDAAPALVGEPVSYRVTPRAAPQKVATLDMDRTDRLRVEWPALRKLDRRVARVLDRTGKPLPIDVPLSEDAATGTIVLDLPLAPFARGDYAIELTAGSATMSETRKLPFRVK